MIQEASGFQGTLDGLDILSLRFRLSEERYFWRSMEWNGMWDCPIPGIFYERFDVYYKIIRRGCCMYGVE
jgi:hypothetical protein